MKVLAVICLSFALQNSLAYADTVVLAGEQAVISAYKKMEEADRKGDGQLWFSLRDRKTQDTMAAVLKDAIRKGGRSRPRVQYDPLATRVSNNHAVVLGKVSDPESGTTQYDAVLFVMEDGVWKVAREQLSEKPFDQFLLYGLLDPIDGAFMRGGSPWKGIPYATVNTEMVRQQDMNWKIQATLDESCAYVRFEAAIPLPAPGAKVTPEIGKIGKTGGPPPPPPLRFKVTGPALDLTAGAPSGPEYSFSVSALVSTVETPAGKGKTNTRYSVTYALYVKDAAGNEVFESALGDGSSSRMISVRDRFIDVRIPLGGLGVVPAANPKIALEEADSVMLILPYHMEPFAAR
jgi:hypothetical protein